MQQGEPRERLDQTTLIPERQVQRSQGPPRGTARRDAKHTSTRSSTQQGPGQVNWLDFVATDLEIEP